MDEIDWPLGSANLPAHIGQNLLVTGRLRDRQVIERCCATFDKMRFADKNLFCEVK